MARTKKYFVRFYNCEIDMVAKSIEITSQQYWQQLAYFDELIEKTKDDENVGQAFKHSSSYKRDHSTMYMDYCCVGTATIYLYREECDAGYQFVSKRDKSKTDIEWHIS